MKTSKEAHWLNGFSSPSQHVTYTHDLYYGATEYHYVMHHISSGRKWDKVVYGVTKEEGDKLLISWNNTRSDIWNYYQKCTKPIKFPSSAEIYTALVSTVEKPQTNSYHYLPDSHYWTNLDQLLEYMKNPNIPMDKLICSIQCTIENGYNLTKQKMKIEVELDRKSLEVLVKDSEPNYSEFDNTLVKKAGHFYSDQSGRTTWGNLSTLDDKELYQLHLICRNSWS